MSVSDDGDYDRKPDGGRSKGTRQKKKGKQQERVLEHPEIGNKTLPEAQRTPGIDSLTRVISPAK